MWIGRRKRSGSRGDLQIRKLQHSSSSVGVLSLILVQKHPQHMGEGLQEKNDELAIVVLLILCLSLTSGSKSLGLIVVFTTKNY